MPSFASTESARSFSEPEATDLPLRRRNTTMPLATQSSAENAGGRWQRMSDGQEGATTATVFGRCRPSAGRARTTGNYTPSPPGPTNCVTWRRGSSQCPRPVVPGKNVCERHLRYRQERYLRLKAPGETQDGRSPSVPPGAQ
jgi:hypothetical protein